MRKSLFIRIKAYVTSSKKGTPFVIYAVSTSKEKTSSVSIREQHKDYEDVLLNKNVDILLENQLYNCTIELQERTQPLFGPIYNLLQMELAEL